MLGQISAETPIAVLVPRHALYAPSCRLRSQSVVFISRLWCIVLAECARLHLGENIRRIGVQGWW